MWLMEMQQTVNATWIMCYHMIASTGKTAAMVEMLILGSVQNIVKYDFRESCIV